MEGRGGRWRRSKCLEITTKHCMQQFILLHIQVISGGTAFPSTGLPTSFSVLLGRDCADLGMRSSRVWMVVVGVQAQGFVGPSERFFGSKHIKL